MKYKKNKKLKKQLKQSIIGIIFILILITISNINPNIKEKISKIYNNFETQNTISYELTDIPKYEGKPYVEINNNIPNFTEKDYTTEAFEQYSELDSLGRCGVAYANICKETMPKEEEKRGDISSVQPTGWVQKKYDGDYLYNRCHLIGYQLSNENANKKNIITGTRYFNVTGMLPFENKVAEYIKNQKENENKHVLYRVTPIFEGNNLVASGVEIEAYSVEDKGQGICFNVYIYNVEPNININYATGESSKNNNS